MRIRHVRFKNLNSLVGEWTIDFTAPVFASDGIFAITGPTGAGKTTILDAICLALYGRTPRLNKVTKSGNEIMSRHTGECFAEVAIETHKGRFRCFWSQHRARKRPGGDLQPQKHEIVNADTGEVIETKLRDVAVQIEKRTGMDFDRFTRSMLLAQGGFAAFLQAPPDERAPILEQITGTEIYSRISMQVHARRAEEYKALDALEAILAGMTLLEETEAETLKQDLKAKQALETELARRFETHRNALAWLAGIAALEKDKARLDGQQQAFEKRRLAFEPELKRLARANGAMALSGEYARLAETRGQQEKEVQALLTARADLPRIKAALEKAAREQRRATGELDKARESLRKEAVVIKKVRELDVRLAEQGTRVSVSRDAIARAEAEHHTIQQRLSKENAAVAKTEAALEKVAGYLRDNARDGGLVADFLALEKIFHAYETSDKTSARIEKALARAKKKEKTATGARQKQEEKLEKARASLTSAETARQQLTAAIQTRLQGREPGDWRQGLDTLKVRRLLLEKTAQSLARMETLENDIQALTVLLKKLETTRAKLDRETTACLEKQTACQQTVMQLETQMALVNRIRDLEEERAHLADGAPCPLCGATFHPYATGRMPAVGETETALADARKALADQSARLTGLRVRQAETEKDITRAGQDRAEKQTELGTESKASSAALVSLALGASPITHPDTVKDELARVLAEIAASEEIVADIEKKVKEEQTAATALEAARARHAKAEKKHQDAVHDLATAQRDQERLARESAEAARQTEAARQEALMRVGRYGVTDIPVIELGGILAQLAQRRDTWQATQEKKNNHEKELAALTTKTTTHLALLAKMDAELGLKREAHQRQVEAADALKEKRRARYGEKKPDEEERRLSDAVDAADKTLVKAREANGRIEKDLTNLEGNISNLTRSTEARDAELSRMAGEMNTLLNHAGFKDEADYRAACLRENERIRLMNAADDLRREQTELETRRKDNVETLAREREKKITDQPQENLAAEADTCEKRLKETQQAMGAISQRLSEDKTMREKHARGVIKIEAQKRECRRWDRLHELIGSADGKKYRNFAQGLTFEMMVAHANRQLMKMTDRYLLIRDDLAPLELSVIDNYQAGEIRSTKNLSGGESFIVSLSLALGLSHMASRNVRVDSLFLDEGFGALDEDALETALETLAGLQRDGKLIGVISHVPALKERIATRIQVTPTTGGRSRINGPGCNRITD